MNPGLGVRAALALAGLSMTAGPSAAQISDNLSGLIGQNAEKYLAPLPAAFSGALNTGIFRTGNIPQAGLTAQIGFEAMIVAYEEDLMTYTPTLPDGFEALDGEDLTAQSITGDGEATTIQGMDGLQAKFPGGFGIENFAVAVPQLTVGNFMGTRATLRYIALELGDVEIGDLELLGFGLQHSITQYLAVPGPKPVDVAVGFFYQSFKLGEDDLIKSNSLHLNATASKSFGIFEPYAGLGYDTYSFEVNYVDANEEDVKVEFDSENSLHLTLGGAANFGFANVHAELNIASAIGIAAGLSVGI